MSKHTPPAPRGPKRRPAPARRHWKRTAIVAGIVAAFAGTVVVPRLLAGGDVRPPTSRPASGPAPAFSERDVVTNAPVTSSSLRGRNVLLFFSEGVMCQACFVQIRSLQARADELRRRGLVLVNVTTDPPGALRQAANAYRITTPLVSDENRDMSGAYDVLGQGMHPSTAGHTFVLVDRAGRIRWRKDYGTMFVPPSKLLGELPRV